MPNKWHVKRHELRGLILMMPHSGLVAACTLHGRNHFRRLWVKKESPWADSAALFHLLDRPALTEKPVVTCAAHFSSALSSSLPSPFRCAIRSIWLEDSYPTEISKRLFCICCCWLRQELLISSYATRGWHSPTFYFFTQSSPRALPQLKAACATHATYVTQKNSWNTNGFTKPMQIICHEGTIQFNAYQ